MASFIFAIPKPAPPTANPNLRSSIKPPNSIYLEYYVR